MAQNRMQVRENLRLGAFMPPAHPILVLCVKCGRCATMLKFVFSREARIGRFGRCSCLHCGHQWRTPAELHFFSRGPLWLKMPCHKNVLWILNRPHLEFMEQFIAADLREERMPEMSNHRLSAALPRWLIAGKNRDDVVRCLTKLREKLEATKLD